MPLPSDAMIHVGLAEAIAELRAELGRAQAQDGGQGVRFAGGPVEVELAVEFGWTPAGSGAYKLSTFVGTGGEPGPGGPSANKIALTLTVDPLDRAGDALPGRSDTAPTTSTAKPTPH